MDTTHIYDLRMIFADHETRGYSADSNIVHGTGAAIKYAGFDSERRSSAYRTFGNCCDLLAVPMVKSYLGNARSKGHRRSCANFHPISPSLEAHARLQFSGTTRTPV